VSIQESADTDATRLSLKKIEGGTWLDYLRAYSGEVKSWLRLVGFGKSRYRLAVVDTTSFQSVLALDALDEGTMVLALTAGRESTPMEQNTSYVALQVAMRRRLPLILAGKQYMDQTILVTPESGLVSGEGALAHIVRYVVASIGNLQDFVAVDSRLGIRIHSFSAVFSASERVYKTYDDALRVQEVENSLQGFPTDIHTAYLLASVYRDARSVVNSAFDRYKQGIPKLMSAQIAITERGDRSGLYDLFLVLGIDEGVVDGILKEGYLSVVARAKSLAAEEIIQ
jgi:hypothetical protein